MEDLEYVMTCRVPPRRSLSIQAFHIQNTFLRCDHIPKPDTDKNSTREKYQRPWHKRVERQQLRIVPRESRSLYFLFY